MQLTADFTVIGGGIIGLSIASELLDRNPTTSVLVIEKELSLASHASGRNSGVLHAGFYYAPDSLKARLTRDGNRQLRNFCEEEGVEIHNVGKVVVTQNESQLASLDELFARGIANGVDVSIVSSSELHELEPLATTCDRALWSPTTGVADPGKVIEAVAQRFSRKGGKIRFGSAVVSAAPGTLVLTDGTRIATGHIINSAGLHADTVAHWFGVGLEYRMLPFKGLYWFGDWAPGRLTRHVYPVPDPQNPFLGVHLTVTVNGNVKIGPTAIPALWRENYGGLSGFSASEMLDILRVFPRFLKSPHHDVFGLLRSELPKYNRKHLINQAKSLVPSINPSDFRTKGKPGIRAQLLHIPSGKLEMDFVVQGDERSTHVLNAVSPAWTSAFAFSKLVVAQALDSIG